MKKNLLPHVSASLVDGTGRASREFYTFLLALADRAGVDMAAELQALSERIDALEGGQQGEAIRAIGSIVARDGILSLIGDTDNPAGRSYYGSNASGERGWWQIIDAIAAGNGLEKSIPTDGYNVLGDLDDASQLPATADVNDAYLIDGDYWAWDGVEWSNEGPPSGEAILSLAELPDAGGGALRKFTRDQYGRVAGTSTATTNDLPEGTANLYYTDARVDARIAAAGGIQVGEVLVADGISPPEMLTDEAETDFLYQG